MGLPIMDGIRAYIINGHHVCSECAQCDDFQTSTGDAIICLMRSENLWVGPAVYCAQCGKDITITNLDTAEDETAMMSELEKAKRRYSA